MINQKRVAAEYRKAAKIAFSSRNLILFYATIDRACYALHEDCYYVCGPAVELMRGEALGTPKELATAYLLLASVIEAGDA